MVRTADLIKKANAEAKTEAEKVVMHQKVETPNLAAIKVRATESIPTQPTTEEWRPRRQRPWTDPEPNDQAATKTSHPPNKDPTTSVDNSGVDGVQLRCNSGVDGNHQIAYTPLPEANSGVDRVQLGCNSGSNLGVKRVQLQPLKRQADAQLFLLRLPRLSRRIIDEIFESILVCGGGMSSPLSVGSLAQTAGCTKDGVKTALARLIAAKVIRRVDSRRGPGGFTSYEFPEPIFQAALALNRVQLGCNSGVNKGADAPSSSSNSNSIIKNSTTTTASLPELPPEWQAVNFSELREMNLHIGETQLKQFWRAGLDPVVVQQSAFHFAYALQHTDLRQKIRTDPLNYFVGSVLGNGAYAAPQGYTAYRRRVIESVMAQKAEDDRDREQHQERQLALTPGDGSGDEKPALVLQRQTIRDLT